MGESENRGMEGSWSTGEAFFPIQNSVPVECLLNGMNVGETLMFGGSGHIIPPQFRRFHPHPTVHLNNGHLGGELSAIPQHSLVHTRQDNSNSDSVTNDPGGPHDLHSMTQSIEDVLEESEEGSEEEEEDLSGMGHSIPISAPLVDCQQQQLGGEGLEQRGPTIMSINDQCQKGPLNPRVHLHSQIPIMLPILPINISPMEEFQGEPPRNEVVHDGCNNDPNSGLSVYGKMYFENRIVFHLKQWTDNGHGNNMTNNEFSCGGIPPQKGQLTGCAVCRLKSPHETHLGHKDNHRHTMKAVLFTFEDFIIVELYPEEAHPIQPNNMTDPPPSKIRIIEEDKTMQMTYLPPNHSQSKQGNHIEIEPLGPSHKVPDHNHPDADCWLDDFESEEELKTGEENEEGEATWRNSNQNQGDSCCQIMNLKLTHQQHQQQVVDYDEGSKAKDCSQGDCSQDYITNDQMESHHECSMSDGKEIQNSVREMIEGMSEEDSVQSIYIEPFVKKEPEKKFPAKKKKWTCPVDHCSKTFNVKHFLTSHLDKSHSSGNPFRCERCDLQFGDHINLSKHSCKKALKERKGGKGRKKESEEEELKGNKENPPEDSEEKRRGMKTDNSDADDLSEDDEYEEDEDGSSESPENNPDCSPGEDDEEEFEKEEIPFKKGGKKPFACNICGKGFTVERRLLNHKISHTSERTSQCEKCGKRFARKDKLMRHMYVHSEEKMFSCDICQKRFSRRDKLSDHLKSHGSEEIHNCPMCQKQFLRPDILKQHVKLHGMGNKHQCPECLRFVTGKDRLEKHMSRHEEAKALGQTLLCPLCTKYFIQRQSLKAHIKKFHPGAAIEIDLPPPPLNNVPLESNKPQFSEKGKFVCPECKKEFARKQALKKHLKKHSLCDEGESERSSDSKEEMPETANSSAVHLTQFMGSPSTPPMAHAILPSPHPPTPPIHVPAPPAHLIQTGGICQGMTHHHQHHVLSHGLHPNDPGNLHLTTHGLSPIQHHVNMPQTICGSSYLLAYPHYPYQ